MSTVRSGPRRAVHARRSWLLLPGAEAQRLKQAPATGADVLIQELEDFTPPERRPEARAMAPSMLGAWQHTGAVAGVRVNPLEVCGLDDLEAVMPGRPDVVMMAMVAEPDQVRALDDAVTGLERRHGIAAGTTELVPNIETARGLVQIQAIVAASPRVTALLLATEDMVADLGGVRTPQCTELAYVRSRFLVECAAAGVLAIDCPYTYGDSSHLEADIGFGRTLGYKAKCVVNTEQVGTINRLMTPSTEEVAKARRTVAAFDDARANGKDRAEVDGLMVEVPTYKSALRLLARHEELKAAG